MLKAGGQMGNLGLDNYSSSLKKISDDIIVARFAVIVQFVFLSGRHSNIKY